MIKDRTFPRVLCFLVALPIASCAYISQSGPQKTDIRAEGATYDIIPVLSRADLPSPARSGGSGEVPKAGRAGAYSDKVRSRDSLRFIITDLTVESPFHTTGAPYLYGPIEVPEDGSVGVPYIGEVQVIGRSLAEVSAELDEKVKPVSNTAKVSVTRAGRLARTANVIGSVKNPGPVPLDRNGITSMDLLSVAGGPAGAGHLFEYTLRRGERDYTFDYPTFRKRSFTVEEGDLLSVSPDTGKRFYVMGAINQPSTVPFPVPAPTLADALGAASGLNDLRSDPTGVFVFRKGNPDQVYTFDLKNPNVVLLTQRFPIHGEDLVYVTEAPLARWSRLISQALPVTQVFYNGARGVSAAGF